MEIRWNSVWERSNAFKTNASHDGSVLKFPPIKGYDHIDLFLVFGNNGVH